MSEHMVQEGALAPVFLSASVPDPSRDPVYAQTARPARIREAVTQLARVVLPHTLLVFGGHPAISPLVLTVAQQLGAVDRVVIYQSRFFEKMIAPESMGFVNLKWTDEVGGDREQSLETMRGEMLGSYDFGAGVFVGGMKGIEDEYAMFRSVWPGVGAYPVASGGGAARMLFDRGEGPQDQAMRGMLERELVYGYLFQKLLGLVP
jgi:SLOG cluster3 family